MTDPVVAEIVPPALRGLASALQPVLKSAPVLGDEREAGRVIRTLLLQALVAVRELPSEAIAELGGPRAALGAFLGAWFEALPPLAPLARAPARDDIDVAGARFEVAPIRAAFGRTPQLLRSPLMLLSLCVDAVEGGAPADTPPAEIADAVEQLLRQVDGWLPPELTLPTASFPDDELQRYRDHVAGLTGAEAPRGAPGEADGALRDLLATNVHAGLAAMDALDASVRRSRPDPEDPHIGFIVKMLASVNAPPFVAGAVSRLLAGPPHDEMVGAVGDLVAHLVAQEINQHIVERELQRTAISVELAAAVEGKIEAARVRLPEDVQRLPLELLRGELAHTAELTHAEAAVADVLDLWRRRADRAPRVAPEVPATPAAPRRVGWRDIRPGTLARVVGGRLRALKKGDVVLRWPDPVEGQQAAWLVYNGAATHQASPVWQWEGVPNAGWGADLELEVLRDNLTQRQANDTSGLLQSAGITA